jgi:hypothetical protein
MAETHKGSLFGSGNRGNAEITGNLPTTPITGAPGSQVTVMFPITWSVDAFLFTPGLNGNLLSELKGSGTGVGSAVFTILQQDSGNPPYYSGYDFTYTGVFAPEPSSGFLLGFGSLMIIALALYRALWVSAGR